MTVTTSVLARALLTTICVGAAAIAFSSCTLDREGMDDGPGPVGGSTSCTECGGVCVDTDTNPDHCGGCDSACGAGLICMGGACVDEACADCPEGAICDNGTCSCGGQTLCANTCIDTTTDLANCGGCGNDCGAGNNCVDSMCTGPCTLGEVVSCYSGPNGTAGTGACAEGQRTCDANGVFGPCVGEVTPQPEVCGNVIDEDCDGMSTTGPCLDDGGLVVRYYLDEAASGTNPMTVLDAAPNPLDLSLLYSNEFSYAEPAAGQRGLFWSNDGRDGGASVDVDNTKIAADLQGAAAMTIELVADVEDINGGGSRFVWIGNDQEGGRVALRSSSTDRIQFWQSDSQRADWAVDFPSMGRVVYHLVMDTGVAAGEQLKLYINGAQVSAEGYQDPTGNIDLANDKTFVIGNREAGDRSIQGTIHYVALYNQAFDAARVTTHTTELTARDDTP